MVQEKKCWPFVCNHFRCRHSPAREGATKFAPETTYPISVELQVHQRLSLPGHELAKTRHPLPARLSHSKSAIRVIRVWTRRVRVRVCRGRIGRTGNGTADDGTRRDAGGDAAPTSPVISASVAATADVDVAVDVDIADVAAVHVGTV